MHVIYSSFIAHNVVDCVRTSEGYFERATVIPLVGEPYFSSSFSFLSIVLYSVCWPVISESVVLALSKDWLH